MFASQELASFKKFLLQMQHKKRASMLIDEKNFEHSRMGTNYKIFFSSGISSNFTAFWRPFISCR